MKIYIGCDHRGVEIKKEIIDFLKNKGIEVFDTVLENSENDDYPDFAYEVCKNVLNNNALGILICGSGIGMSIAANKVKGIRCARCLSVDDALSSKSHNGANVMALDSFTNMNTLKEMVDTFINTNTPNEIKHLKRIEKVINIENGVYNEL